MVKIGTISLHFSHNYGSALQAYALQEFLKKILGDNFSYQIINLQTKKQKETIYHVYETHPNRIKKFILNIYFKPYAKQIEKRKKLFAEFQNNFLQLTKEYTTIEELKNSNDKFDFYIAGSDQIWNFNRGMPDFEWSFLLNFTNSPNKISYAASMGSKRQPFDNKTFKKFFNYLKQFKYVSVRDKYTQNLIKKFSDIEPTINADPTILLDKKSWDKLERSNDALIKGDYIFLYHFFDDNAINIAKKLSKRSNIPVITTKRADKLEIIYGFKQKYDVGPIEFINFVKHSKICVCQSFHCCIFSVIYHKPFVATDYKNDERVKTLLNELEIDTKLIKSENYDDNLNPINNFNYTNIEKNISRLQEESKKYLLKALKNDKPN